MDAYYDSQSNTFCGIGPEGGYDQALQQAIALARQVLATDRVRWSVHHVEEGDGGIVVAITATLPEAANEPAVDAKELEVVNDEPWMINHIEPGGDIEINLYRIDRMTFTLELIENGTKCRGTLMGRRRTGPYGRHESSTTAHNFVVVKAQLLKANGSPLGSSQSLGNFGMPACGETTSINHDSKSFLVASFGPAAKVSLTYATSNMRIKWCG
jgi:hypothetical protein